MLPTPQPWWNQVGCAPPPGTLLPALQPLLRAAMLSSLTRAAAAHGIRSGSSRLDICVCISQRGPDSAGRMPFPRGACPSLVFRKALPGPPRHFQKCSSILYQFHIAPGRHPHMASGLAGHLRVHQPAWTRLRYLVELQLDGGFLGSAKSPSLFDQA